MTERDFWLWGSFGVFFIAIAVEVLLLRVRVRRALQHEEEQA